MKKLAKRGTGDRSPPDDPEQSKRFEEMARKLEADETGVAFERALKVSVKPKELKARPARQSICAREPKRVKAK